MKLHFFPLLLCFFVGVNANAESSSTPIERLEGVKLSEATGYYGRSRALLISAIREFDKALKLSKPDALFDSAEWRQSILDRVEELERVLDPQPRVTKDGVRFDPDSRLLNK